MAPQAIDSTPIRRLYQVHRHWQCTLKRLAIRYRRPYTARHPSVSWDLMLGGNPLYVAQQHGHRLITMLTIYATWTEGSLEADVVALRRAMDAPAYAARSVPRPVARFGNRTANESVRARRQKTKKISNYRNLDWRSGRDSSGPTSAAPARLSPFQSTTITLIGCAPLS